jgi:hypothetical protein
MKEEKLSGGSVSRPVKVGDTVRRLAGEWTPAVHALLKFLCDEGFELAPRPLGLDEQGREILTYLPGEAAHRPWPEVLRDGDGLAQMAQALRRYHDVVAGFTPDPALPWRIGRVEWRRGQIIRHGDLGPWNTLWSGNQLSALLDWDFAEPGERITDVAQLAWYFGPLRGEAGWREAGFTQRPDFAKRLQVICEHYGDFTPEKVVRELGRLQEADLEITRRLGGGGVHPWNIFYDRGGEKIIRAENEWLKKTFI